MPGESRPREEKKMTIHKGFNSVGVTVLLLCVAVGIGVVKLTNIPLAGVFFSLVGLYFLFAIVVVDQWEKVAVLRFGKYRGLRGPGLFLIIPIAETLSRYVDQRVRVTTVSAESALRESIGRHQLAQMITDRETLGQELQRILDEKTTPWGITVQSVEIRDVRIPQALENAMSTQAQAERERQARVILGEAEVQVSEQFAEASRVYNDNPGALHLRGMNMLYEAMREKGSMVIVPSSAIESMGLGGTLTATTLAKQQ